MSWLTYQVHVLTSSHCRISANPSPPTLVCASRATAMCPMHEAIMCFMLPLCVRCGRCVFDVATVCSMLVRCSI